MNPLDRRSAGWLLHPTSLFSAFGCGDLGPAARGFVDQLSAGGVTWWQMLPTHPVGNPPGYSPYSGTSAFATAPLLASGEDLAADGLLSAKDLRGAKVPAGWRVDYPSVVAMREALLRKAYAAFASGKGAASKGYRAFVAREADWLDDWAIYAAARGTGKTPRRWTKFPRELARHDAKAIAEFADRNAAEVEYHRFVQFVLDGQWRRLRAHAAAKGVLLLGDVPIFVSHDSADVWAEPGLWELDSKGDATRVSGCPPDAFAKKGQLWGHPQYRWGAHGGDGYAWWVSRFRRMMNLFDGVRIDHFLGFNRVWSIPGDAKDARGGKWVKTPGREIFKAVKKALPSAAIVAEDLGSVVPEATKLREDFKFPGMRVMQFGFGGGDEHLPWSYVKDCVAYSGTHDNDTVAGWWKTASEAEKRKAITLGISRQRPAYDMVRAVMASVANTAIVPVQDVLELGGAHRMNVPGTAKGNWGWRLGEPLPTKVLRDFAELAHATGRAGKRG